jgi:Family of unknown function (DUF6152)
MKRIHMSLVALTVAGSISCATALAHHSFAAEFDRLKPVTLKGTITKVEWQNPHTRVYMNVRNEVGMTSSWELELSSPNALMRVGWNRHSVRVGDNVTVNGFRAKDGSSLANVGTMFAADGRKILSQQSSADAPAPR